MKNDTAIIEWDFSRITNVADSTGVSLNSEKLVRLMALLEVHTARVISSEIAKTLKMGSLYRTNNTRGVNYFIPVSFDENGLKVFPANMHGEKQSQEAFYLPGQIRHLELADGTTSQNNSTNR